MKRSGRDMARRGALIALAALPILSPGLLALDFTHPRYGFSVSLPEGWVHLSPELVSAMSSLETEAPMDPREKEDLESMKKGETTVFLVADRMDKENSPEIDIIYISGERTLRWTMKPWSSSRRPSRRPPGPALRGYPADWTH